jgi:hypothetical protein
MVERSLRKLNNTSVLPWIGVPDHLGSGLCRGHGAVDLLHRAGGGLRMTSPVLELVTGMYFGLPTSPSIRC